MAFACFDVGFAKFKIRNGYHGVYLLKQWSQISESFALGAEGSCVHYVLHVMRFFTTNVLYVNFGILFYCYKNKVAK